MKYRISHALLKAEENTQKAIGEIIHFFFVFIWCILWLPMAFVYSFSKSYFPEEKRKNMLQRIFENVYWVLRYHRANGFYTLYGQDIQGVKLHEYIDEKTFWKGLGKLNYNRGISSQLCLLRDKYLFYKYMISNNCPVPRVFAYTTKGCFMNSELIEDAEVVKNASDYFLKEVDGQCASYVKHISNYEELKKEIKSLNKNTKYIMQEKIIQCQEMNAINPYSINTLRVVTVYNNGSPKVLTALLRVGTKQSGDVDNWAAGGLAIGINTNGYLKKYGLYKPGHGLKVSKHPDTGIEFEKFRVPYYDEALNAACEAHKFFYNVGAIGWDIAITEHGPVFVEGNDNFEITLMQACDRPLKKEWEETVKNEKTE